MTEAEGSARMTAVVQQLIEQQYAPYTHGDSIPVLENVLDNPYGVTPNEDVARLAVTMFQAIALATEFGIALARQADLVDPNHFGIYPPVKKGGSN